MKTWKFSSVVGGLQLQKLKNNEPYKTVEGWFQHAAMYVNTGAHANMTKSAQAQHGKPPPALSLAQHVWTWRPFFLHFFYWLAHFPLV